jgi:membrane-associated protein
MHFFEILPLIQTIGLLGIFIFVFIESGLFFGFFLPGDSLLFTAGILASAGHFNLWILLGGCLLAAILGDTVGYWFGRKIGPKLFSRKDSFFWSKKNLDKTARFFESHGNKAVTLARFVPVVRTFTPIMAGTGSMRYRSFLFWNILGGLLWTVSMIFLGYFLGSSVKNVDNYILPIIAVIIFLSFIPVIVEISKNKKQKYLEIENG